MTARGVGSKTWTMARESSTGGSWLRSIPKGMICLSAMGVLEGRELLCRKEGKLLWNKVGG
jgi:hypothetical protein